MAVVNGYATVEQVRAELKDDDGRLDAPLLEKAINAASRAVDAWTGRRFWQDAEPAARLYRPSGPYRVEVDDISTRTGLIVQTDTSGDASWATTWDVGDYELEPLNADGNGGAYAWWEIVSAGGRFPCATRRAAVQVTARWGWSAIPAEVEEATILRAVALFRRKEAPFGVAGFGEFGAVRITRRDADVIDLLAPFQKVMA